MFFFKNKLTVVIIVLSVSFLFLIGYTVKRERTSAVENGVGVTLNSVQGVVYEAGNIVRNSMDFVFNFSKVKKENEALRKENDELQHKLVTYDSILSENDRLQEALNFKNQRNEYKYIGCHIKSRSGGNYLDGFTIDKGLKDGLKKGMIAITSRGLVGQVTSVSNNWAIVQSLSNENIAVGAMVQDTEDNNGIVKGYKDSDNRILAKIYQLPMDSNIKKDDVILTSGQGELYPKEIRIGYVLEVEEDKGRNMKNAIIQPYVDFNKLQEVMIVVPKDQNEIKY